MAKAKQAVSVNDVVKALQKNITWILVPIFILVAFVMTRNARNVIKTDYEKETKLVEAEKRAVDSIATNADHPNQETINKISAEEKTLSDNVFKTWKLMYDEQKAKNKWPQKLSKEFLEIVENAAFESPIGTQKRYILEDYGYFMVNNLPELIKNVNRRRYQVQGYYYLSNDTNQKTGRFEPIYVDKSDELDSFFYLFNQDKSKVYRYFPDEGDVKEITESSKREALLTIPEEEREKYWMEMDRMITNPREFVLSTTSGNKNNRDSDLGNSSSIPGLNESDPAEAQLKGIPNAPIASNDGAEKYPGLPLLERRRRVVGNVDWLNPEIFSLLNWGTDVPYSIEVWYLQENLWVYEALLRVVEMTNHDAENISRAPIKCIKEMLIGKEASSAWTSLKNLSLYGFNPNAENEQPAEMTIPEETIIDDPTGTANATLDETTVRSKILESRYLGASNEPLAAEAAAPFSEFKRMPICLKLIVDQLKIPDILVNCANCSMPIDVQHVRICPEKALANNTTGGSLSEMMNNNTSDISERSSDFNYGKDAINIEIYGVINIYNKPDETIFGKGSTEGETEEGTVPSDSSDAAVSEPNTGDSVPEPASN